MIKEFVRAWETRQEEVRVSLAEKHPKDYRDLVQRVVRILGTPDNDAMPDPERVHEIDDGDYQGTLVYVIGSQGYQPHVYWYVRVWYGSCSGCDTLAGIRSYDDDPPNEEQVKDYMTLALHIVQGLREFNDKPA